MTTGGGETPKKLSENSFSSRNPMISCGARKDDEGVYVSIRRGGLTQPRAKSWGCSRKGSFQTVSKRDAKTFMESLEAVAKKMDVIIEHVHFRKSFAVCSILIPIDLASGEFVEAGIASCKKELPYLCNSYFITNVKKPGEKEIEDFIEHD